MCNPILGAKGIIGLINTTVGVANEINDLKHEKENAKYQSQIALNNAKDAQKEAYRLKQIGIEQARKEKLEGLNQAKYEKAKMASNGFMVEDGNNLLNYEDIIKQSNQNSNATKETYDLKAQNYFDRANSYLNDSNLIIKNYNDSLYSNSLNYLGKASKVASNWYSSK